MNITYGDVIDLSGEYFLVLRDEKERSFGVEDPKYWVKRCRELSTGKRKILKLVFCRRFPVSMGSMEIECFPQSAQGSAHPRSGQGDSRFMQGLFPRRLGRKQRPRPGRGQGHDLLSLHIDRLEADHRTYFFEMLPDILEKFAESCRAIDFLHRHGKENHGDIRRDHLWLEQGTGGYVWIDFDYTYEFQGEPLRSGHLRPGQPALVSDRQKVLHNVQHPPPRFRRSPGRLPGSGSSPCCSNTVWPICARSAPMSRIAEQRAHALFLHLEVFYFTVRELLERSLH